MTTVTDYPVRTCPWFDCRAIWIEDPVMYEDTARCPRCGRNCDDFEYGPERDFGEIAGGSSLKRLFLYSETAGIFRYEDGTMMQTQGAMDEALYRR